MEKNSSIKNETKLFRIGCRPMHEHNKRHTHKIDCKEKSKLVTVGMIDSIKWQSSHRQRILKTSEAKQFKINGLLCMQFQANHSDILPGCKKVPLLVEIGAGTRALLLNLLVYKVLEKLQEHFKPAQLGSTVVQW